MTPALPPAPLSSARLFPEKLLSGVCNSFSVGGVVRSCAMRQYRAISRERGRERERRGPRPARQPGVKAWHSSRATTSSTSSSSPSPQYSTQCAKTISLPPAFDLVTNCCTRSATSLSFSLGSGGRMGCPCPLDSMLQKVILW